MVFLTGKKVSPLISIQYYQIPLYPGLLLKFVFPEKLLSCSKNYNNSMFFQHKISIPSDLF